MSINETMLKTGEYRFTFDTSHRRRWYAPLALFMFAILFIGVRYFYVSASLRTAAIVLAYSALFLFILPLLGTFMIPFTRRYPAMLIFIKIFGIPFAFLGFLFLLAWLP